MRLCITRVTLSATGDAERAPAPRSPTGHERERCSARMTRCRTGCTAETDAGHSGMQATAAQSPREAMNHYAQQVARGCHATLKLIISRHAAQVSDLLPLR